MEDVALGPLDAARAPSSLAGPEPSRVVRRSPEQAEQLVLDLIATHADSLLRTARRYSLCADDAQDAYQRGLEILVRHAHRLDSDRAGGWLHTVVRNEALAINKSRRRIVSGEEVDLDAIEVRTAPSPEERVLGFEQVARSAEALQRLKPQEVRALWLKAMGNSYQEICDATGWTYTKVNRCLAEGRKSFLARYAGIEAGEECRRWAPVLSAMVDGEASAEQLMQLRPHLRNCAGCRAAVRELRGSNGPLAALFPLGGVALGGEGPRFDVPGGDLLSRLWHAVWGDLSDRAATAAYRVQALGDTVLSGKLLAAAASVAALAGGGIVVDEAREAPRAALHAPTVSTAAEQLTSRRVVAGGRPAAPEPAGTEPTATQRSPTRRPRVRRHRRAHRVRVPRHIAAPAGSPRATRAAAARTASAPAPSPATRSTRPASAPSALAPRPAPPPGPRAVARPGTGGEFALEGR